MHGRLLKRKPASLLSQKKNAFDFQQLVTDIVEDAAELPENPTEKKKIKTDT